MEDLLVLMLSLFEVFKRVFQQRDEKEAFETVALILQGQLVDLDSSLAIGAAKLSVELKLPLADSIMLATARANDAQFRTQDADFAGIPGVRYIAK